MTATPSTDRTSILSIQYLRAIAACMVVCVHLHAPLERLGYQNYWPYFLEGGVDIFFVISGFIMWTTTIASTASPLEFARKRLVRIVPLYWLVTTVFVLVLLVRPSFVNNGRFDLAHVASSYLFVPHVHPVMAPSLYPVVMQGWTLNYEMFFYALFFLALFLPRGPRFFSLVATLSGLVVIGLLYSAPQPDLIRFYTKSVLLEFAFGIAIAVTCERNWTISPGMSAGFFLLGVLLLPVSHDIGATIGAPRGLSIGLPAALLVFGSVHFERRARVPYSAVLALLGDASYSLYVTHGIALSAVQQVWTRFGVENSHFTQTLFVIFGLATASAVGVLCYLFVETPLLRAMKRSRSGQGRAHEGEALVRSEQKRRLL